jgi:hypothetical protein
MPYGLRSSASQAVQATLEPRVTTPQGPGDQRRADINVHLDGTTWLVDVGMVCPGTPRLLAMSTDRTPGRAAAVYNDIKVAKHGDQSNFVPFIVETEAGSTPPGWSSSTRSPVRWTVTPRRSGRPGARRCRCGWCWGGCER